MAGFDKSARKAMSFLTDRVTGATTNSAYRPTLAEAVADLDIGTYFSSRDLDGVGPHAGVRWNYKRIAAAPGWQALEAWAAKKDVGLGNVANLTPDAMPISAAQQAALNTKADQTATETALATKAAVIDIASTDPLKGASLVGLKAGGNVQQAVIWVTPEMYGAVGDASVIYDGAGNPTVYGGTDDTAAILQACNAMMAIGGEVRLSKWYRITQPLPVVTKPYAITGVGRFKCGIAYDKTATGDFLRISECWIGKDKDEITSGMLLRDPNILFSGVRLEGWALIGDRSTTNTQNGFVMYRRNDKVRMRDMGAYHVKGWGLMMGYDDRSPINGEGGAKACIRECDIQFEARWCGDAATSREAVGYYSYGWQAGDDASNNNRFDIESFFSDYIGLKISGRNWNGGMMRYDLWDRLMVEGSASDAVVIEGAYTASKFVFIEPHPVAAGTYGLVFQEWATRSSIALNIDAMPRGLSFSGICGGRLGTSGIRLIHGKHITFDDYFPSTYRAQTGTDFHMVVESTITGPIKVTGAASQGYAWLVSCAAAALSYVSIDPGKREFASASVPLIKSAMHEMVYVPDAYPGNTPGMAYSTGSAWITWPVSIRNFRSDDTAVAAASAQNRLMDVQVAGTDTSSAKLKIYNTFDGNFFLQWNTPLEAGHGALPAMILNSDVAANGSSGSCTVWTFTTKGHPIANQGIKLVSPQYTYDEPGLLYRETLQTLNFAMYQHGTYAARGGHVFNDSYPTTGTAATNGGYFIFNTNTSTGGPAGWTTVGTTGAWAPFGIVGGVQAAVQANSTATDVAALVADFNALLTKLKAAKLMAS